MTEYSRMVKGKASVLASGGVAPIALPFMPDYVEFINYDAMQTPTATWIAKGYWDKNMGQGYIAHDFYDVGPVYSTAVATSGGVSTYEQGRMLEYGAALQVASITKASPAVVTTGSAHGLVSGDVVIFEGLVQGAGTGMQQIAGIPFTVTVTGTTTFTIPFNTNQTNFTAIAGSPAGASVKKVLYPHLFFPGQAFISNITLGATTTIDTTAAHNFVVGQEVAFRIPSVYGTTQLNSLPNNVIPGSPIYGYVIAVTDYNTVIVNIDSSAFTAFDNNQPFANYPGLQFPQIVAVGDVNTGGVQISSGSALYPPPYSVAIGTTRTNTVNGPAILGAFVNNSQYGFVMGAAAAVAAQSGQSIYWRAYLHDLSYP